MKKQSEGFSYDLISKYRAVLMGVAILAILFCHVDTALKHHGVEVTRLANCLHIFTVGVDIFMLLSGFGLYYSCAGKYDSYFRFLKKRVSRILPYYLVIAGITHFILVIMDHLPATLFFENLFFISWAKRGSTVYWFIFAILVFYLVFPLIYRVVSRIQKHLLLLFLLFFAAFWIATAFLDSSFGTYQRFRIAIERFPIFVFGACCGKLSQEGAKLSKRAALSMAVIGFAASAMLYISNRFEAWISHTHFMYYLTRGLLAIAVIITGIWIMDFLERRFPSANRILFHFFSFLGGITLELYLFHQSWLLLLDFPISAMGYVLAAVLLPLSFAFGLSWLRDRLKKVK